MEMYFDMSECEDQSTDEMASEFIVSTCQMLPKSFSPVSDHMHNLMITAKPAVKEYAITCGSTAEFYIRPLNKCVADIDFLISCTDEVAFSGDFPVLPNDISGLADTIYCHKIESYKRFPGFVRLRITAMMIYNWQCKRYEINSRALKTCYKTLDMTALAIDFSPDPVSQGNISGPAIKLKSPAPHQYSSSDFVRSVWCPKWPREAHNWIIRKRKYIWPTVDTISEVLQNGCHVVFVQHRNCRDDREQWRFSFSVAEIILLQSWTQIQQIVYHLLRFFIKRELIHKDCPKEDEVLCSYHLKTLMLWTCEEMPPEWWNSSSVIVKCCELLKKLSKWVKERHCPNYFIPEANLFHEPSRSTILFKIERRIYEFYNSEVLCRWFVENYIAPLFSSDLPVGGTIKATLHFVNSVLLDRILELRKGLKSKSLEFLLTSTFQQCQHCCRLVARLRSSSGLRECLKSGCYRKHVSMEGGRGLVVLPTIENDHCLAYYDNLLHILHSVYGLSCGEISYTSMLLVELVNTISMQPKIVRSRYHNFPKAYSTQDGQFQFQRAQDLMENLTGLNSHSEFQLIVLMSKRLLRKALEYDEFKYRGVDPAALAYLASLHIATAEYHQTKHLCLAVVVDQKFQRKIETLNAGCLLFIDDVARIVGLCVLHKKITGNNVHYIGRRLCLDLRLSPKVFANYLNVISAERISKHFDSYMYYDVPCSAFPMDNYLTILTASKRVALTKSVSCLIPARQIAYRTCRANLVTETESTMVNPGTTKNTVIYILMEYALENMISFCIGVRRDFGIQCNIVDCYRALFLHECRQYDEVMKLCELILRDLEPQCNIKKLAFANILLVPPLDSFFDGDVQSLAGLHTLFYYLSPLNDCMRKLQLGTTSTFAHFFARSVYYEGKALSVFLLKSFPIRSYYFLGRHFLAKYLKVRCCIGGNFPYAKALAQFADHKTQFPFECMIRRFLLYKFSFIK